MPPNASRRRVSFSIREMLMLMFVVALLLGWRSYRQQTQQRMAELERLAEYPKRASEWDAMRLKLHAARTRHPAKGLLGSSDLEGAHLEGSVIVGQTGAFYSTVFNHANLRYATLTGGASAFQGARFFNANLQGARLTGGVSAFQLASFIGADLTGATLAGGGSSFQGATFERATLVGVKLLCSGASFQMVNVSAANFRSADLSSLQTESLKSCYFRGPPLYDGDTKFPTGFDPIKQGWKLSAEPAK